jgi:hypothetical protein
MLELVVEKPEKDKKTTLNASNYFMNKSVVCKKKILMQKHDLLMGTHNDNIWTNIFL